MQECQKVQSLLACYEKASGQFLNMHKSTHPDTLNQIKALLGVQVVKQCEKYLGLPTLIGKNKKASFKYIKERVWAKLQGWKEQLLSQAGREVLLKAVI